MLTYKQKERLADLFIDLAKGAFLAGFVLTPITGSDWLLVLKAFSLGTGCTGLSLYLIRQK